MALHQIMKATQIIYGKNFKFKKTPLASGWSGILFTSRVRGSVLARLDS